MSGGGKKEVLCATHGRDNSRLCYRPGGGGGGGDLDDPLQTCLCSSLAHATLFHRLTLKLRPQLLFPAISVCLRLCVFVCISVSRLSRELKTQ